MKVKGISERCAFFPFNNVPKKPVHVVFGSPLKRISMYINFKIRVVPGVPKIALTEDCMTRIGFPSNYCSMKFILLLRPSKVRQLEYEQKKWDE